MNFLLQPGWLQLSFANPLCTLAERKWRCRLEDRELPLKVALHRSQRASLKFGDGDCGAEEHEALSLYSVAGEMTLVFHALLREDPEDIVETVEAGDQSERLDLVVDLDGVKHWSAARFDPCKFGNLMFDQLSVDGDTRSRLWPSRSAMEDILSKAAT